MAEINIRKLIENYLWIRPKDVKEGEKLLKFNAPQERLYNTIKKCYEKRKPVRIIILKARQMGFSTATGGIVFANTITSRLVQSAIITHRDSTTNELFKMYKRFYNKLPKELQPAVQASNAKELIFNTKDGKGLDSTIKCMTAVDEGVGRGGTTQFVHMSEYAFWKNAEEVYTAIMQCVPDTPDSMVIIESTANGFNDFKDLWDKAVAGENDYIPLFFAWWEMDSYRREYTGFKLTDEEEELKRRFNLDNEQLAWRRWCIANNCKGNIDKFHQEYPSTPDEAFIFSGNSYFDMPSLHKAKEMCRQPLARGYFKYGTDNNYKPTHYEWVDDPRGIINIYERCKSYNPYVVGGDTAGEGSDSFTAQMLDNLTGTQVASLKYEGSNELYYSQQMYCLGMMYNQALMAIETNFSTYPQRKLEEWNYDKFYIRESYDNYTHKLKPSFGFRTTTASRPAILANLQSIIKETPEKIKDYSTIVECEKFVKNESGKPEAMEGAHDDLVMALAIAYNARNQQEFKPFEHDVEPTKKQLPMEFLTDEEIADIYGEGDETFLW